MEDNNVLTITNDKSTKIQHNRSKTFERLSKLCHTEIKQAKDTFDPYTSFIYRDHVTHNRYQISKLKNRKPTKNHETLKDEQIDKMRKTETNDEFQYYSEQLNFLQSIRQNRNKQLMAGFVKLRQEKIQTLPNTEVETQGLYLQACNKQKNIPKQRHISRLKKRIQAEVMSLNQQFLRQYLYYEQPFDTKLIQINRYSDSKVLDEQKINKLKKNLIECLAERKQKQNDPHFKIHKKKTQTNLHTQASQKKWKNWVTTYYERKAVKQNINVQIDKKFDDLWAIMGQEISQKVKFEGEFNWRSKYAKKSTINKMI